MIAGSSSYSPKSTSPDVANATTPALVIASVSAFLPGNRHTILGNAWHTIALIQDHVASLRAEGDPDCLGKFIHATYHVLTGIVAEPADFRGHLLYLTWCHRLKAGRLAR
jgi:hypothetical protein